MKSLDKEFSKWELEREKGYIRFIIRISLPAIIGVMVGRCIALIFLFETVWGWDKVNEILISGFWAGVGAVPLSFIIWRSREKKYHAHIASLKSNK
ncbi:hypothetical protein ACQEXU_21150 [Vibrio sp. TRT 21S02]|uniref:hypothetical protein n=1 Tax=Vibrio sp. TRT 21S02 TaxID=3418507 RepID=UPI003CFA3386